MAEHRITVRYFASLREALGGTETVTIAGGSTLGQLRVLRSPYGHDAFLKETDRIDSILTSALRAAGDLA